MPTLGRQKDFVDFELNLLGRETENVSAVAGYAGGTSKSKQVCYFTGPKSSHYERLGHCEAVRVAPSSQLEFEQYARRYFNQFVHVPGRGMARSDPQDRGPGYRCAVGIPGGLREGSPYVDMLRNANQHAMELRDGRGAAIDKQGRSTEPDILNVVFVYDSESEPGHFYQAEHYHQCHDGAGQPFPQWYKRDVKNSLERRLLSSTGCPDV